MSKRRSPVRVAEGRVDKMEKAGHEFKEGKLHSGSKHGPLVKSRKQMIAIGLSEQRKENAGGYDK